MVLSNHYSYTHRSVKQERVQWRNYQTRNKAQQDVMNYIAMW